jgi:hypothetical protein
MTGPGYSGWKAPPGVRQGDREVVAGQCGLSLRQLDRALWIGASSPQSPG